MPASSSISADPRRAVRLLAPLLIVLLGACSSNRLRVAQDPYYETFYEKARLIMTGEEDQIYRHLPDVAARDAFIDEFWKKRDPYPDTDVNEMKVEFERRIAYANRWFKENRPIGRGWDTPRGRILIQLGEPDNRFLTEMISDPNIKGYERWVYYDYQLELIFIDSQGFGEFKLRNWPAELLTAIDLARASMVPLDPAARKKSFFFKAGYEDGRIRLDIPVKAIRFQEEGENIRADYRITVTAYLEYIKIDTAVFQKQLSYPRDAVPGERTVGIDLPYPLERKGKYYLEVILEDPFSGARSRDFVDFKL